MLQRLENAYLAILRAVVIFASGILLIGFVIFGLGALKGFGDGPGEKVNQPEIASAEVIEKLTAQKPMSDRAKNSITEYLPKKEAVDPNQQYYAASAKSIVSFVIRISGGEENLSEQQVSEIIMSRATAYDSNELSAAYAKGFSETAAKVLANKKIEDLAKNTSALDVVNQMLNTFTEEFNAKIQSEHERISTAQQNHILAKAESASNLYLAGACFGLFLLIVFLSIFIKIERNLRNLEKNRPMGA